MRQTRAIIDLKALEHNYNFLRRLLNGRAKVSAVVKGNAYGHGAVGISRKLESLGIDAFSVAYPSEGIALRENGITRPIVIIGPIHRDEFPEIVENNLVPTIYDMYSLSELDSWAKGKGLKIQVHIKIDTGMNRLGFTRSEIPSLIDRLLSSNSIEAVGTSTHLLESDNPDHRITEEQRRIFDSTVAQIESALKKTTLKHMANSAACGISRDFHFDMVRPGLMLYGYSTLKDEKVSGSLKPVLSLKSVLALVKKVRKGDHVGYNRLFTAQKDSLIGIVPIGYADGFLKKYSSLGYILFRGKRARIIGSICMDMIFCDLSEFADARTGEEVTLIGPDGAERLTAFDYAKASSTIPYEILTSISERVPRVFVDE